jgi:hypothetical protein
MARSISTIKEVIRVEKNAQSTISSIPFAEEGGSRVGVFNQIADIVAISQNIHEQLFDEFKTEIEDIATNAIPGTAAWIQDKVFKFQYDATTPQYVEIIDFVPQYATVDEDLRIITRCAVLTLGNGRIQVKVAKSDPPVPLGASELTALTQYLENILPAGPYLTVTNLDADKLYIDANIYYDGQYIDSIQATVEQALNDYLADLPFDGVVAVSKIQDTIQAVEGVKDVVINEVRARKDTTVFASATTVTRQWATVAGYIVEETTASNTWGDTITYIVE